MSCVNNGPKAEQTFKNKHIKRAMKRGTSAIESVVVFLALAGIPATAANEGEGQTVTVNKPSTTKVPDERNWVSFSTTGNTFPFINYYWRLFMLYRFVELASELSYDVRSNFYVWTLNEVPC